MSVNYDDLCALNTEKKLDNLHEILLQRFKHNLLRQTISMIGFVTYMVVGGLAICIKLKRID